MLWIRQVDESVWGAFDQAGKQVLSIEKRHPECSVRKCSSESRMGGKLLAEFYGPEAVHESCRWAKNYESARN
jgi:hypothetical protein